MSARPSPVAMTPPGEPVIVVKVGGGVLGLGGENLPFVVDRVRELSREARVVVVPSAPLAEFEGGISSLTDIATTVGQRRSRREEAGLEVFEAVYRALAERFMESAPRGGFFSVLEAASAQWRRAFEAAAEERRFAGVVRARALAHTGELTMAAALTAILTSHGIDAGNLDFAQWPLVTDGDHDSASFLLEESRLATGPLVELLSAHRVVCVAGFVGKTLDGAETTYERGGSDRSALDLGILLGERRPVRVELLKDGPVLSADPKVERRGLEHIPYLTYAEVRLAGTFGMKILNPIAIKDLEESGGDFPVRIVDFRRPERATLLGFAPDADAAHPLKIVVGRKDCAVVRMGAASAVHLLVSLERERRYSEFLQLSPCTLGGRTWARVLFFDGGYVRRMERSLRAFDPEVEIAYGRGVVTVVGDRVVASPAAISSVIGALGESGLQVLALDVQEETFRIVIIVRDEDDSVERAIRAIHARREQFARAEARRAGILAQ
ncbi:MAG: aspartate kinase [Myxococcota bacterium]|nr:aspartate kinase [Myxococcota bacterium]